MAFRQKKAGRVAFETPEALFRDLKGKRTVEGLLSHQADILRAYQDNAFDKSDVAIELPTGSGKTLVGLLIGEFRRITQKERVLYLCPTRQLVRQVVEQSERKYGIKLTAFVGPVRDYDPAAKTRYQTGATIAVATYSALFNTNPFFDSPQLIILDDAHASENYIAANWSLLAARQDNEPVYLGLLDIFKGALAPDHYQRFLSNEVDNIDVRWVEKVPTAFLADNAPAVNAFLDENTRDTRLQYPWSLLRGQLEGCHAYISHSGILIRPYIPPSMTHAPFAGAKQRVFMSATLGRGGDLERMTGVRSFHRLPIPVGWDKQGIGRRFFMFPDLSLTPEEVSPLTVSMIKQAGRALILVPSDRAAREYTTTLEAAKIGVFTAGDIEASKDEFIASSQAAMVLANRYDGIDLLGEECRLLIIEGLPKAANLQEQFLTSRMACGTLLHDRIRTRIVQAVGRCTRSATDYAAVCVIGEDFSDWMILNEKRALFHPELQGELTFGVEQSQDVTAEDFLENLAIFFEHDEDWDTVDTTILEYRDQAKQGTIVAEDMLFQTASLEVDYQYALWNGDYEHCVQLCQQIASVLSGDVVKGLRGFWYYLGASSASLAFTHLRKKVFQEKAAELYSRASMCAPSLGWLRCLAEQNESTLADELPTEEDALLVANVERMEMVFESRGFVLARKFERAAKNTLDGLASDDANRFEEAHRLLGELLGFEAGNSAGQAAPDPWWISDGSLCIVSEDKSDSNPGHPECVRHTRQAASHPKWIREHVPLKDDAQIITIMVTPATTIEQEVPTYADEVMWWHINEFRAWARKAVAVVRRIRATFSGTGSSAWRASTADTLRGAGLDPASIAQEASKKLLRELPIAGGNE